MDLAVHPREYDLILGTHGRSAFVLDDIRPLWQMNEQILSRPLHLFSVPTVQQYRVKQTGASRFPGAGEYRGENRPYGALITFSLADRDLPHPDEETEKQRMERQRRKDRQAAELTTGTPPAEEASDREDEDEPQVTIAILDDSGARIRSLDHPVHRGVNRAVWDLRRDPFKMPSDQEAGFLGNDGPEVLPGTYRIKVSYGDLEEETTVAVVADPRFAISPAERQAKWTAVASAGALQETISRAISRILQTRADIQRVLDHADVAVAGHEDDAEDPYTSLRQAAGDLQEALTAMEKRLREPPDTRGIIDDDDALSRVRTLLYLLSSSWDAPTVAQLQQLAKVSAHTGATLEEFNLLYDVQVGEFRRKVNNAGIELLARQEPIQIDP